MTQMIEVPVVRGSNLKGQVPAPVLARELGRGDRPSRGSLVIRLLLAGFGDKRFAWNPLSAEEIREAEEFFAKCIEEGMVPYAVDRNGKAATLMPKFDPGAGEAVFRKIAQEDKQVVMMPQKMVAGG
jgi:hypothetical protein